MHRRRKLISAQLSRELRKTSKRRNFPLRKGDRVKVLCGEFRGKEGRVTGTDVADYKIFMEGLVVKKPDGKEKAIPISPSNVMILELDLSDEKRKRALARRSGEKDLDRDLREKPGEKTGGKREGESGEKTGKTGRAGELGRLGGEHG